MEIFVPLIRYISSICIQFMNMHIYARYKPIDPVEKPRRQSADHTFISVSSKRARRLSIDPSPHRTARVRRLITTRITAFQEMRAPFCLVVVVGVLLLLRWPASSLASVQVARTITVDQLGGGDYTTVQSAVDAVPDGNSQWVKIYVKHGSYRFVQVLV
uniref:Pectinesterase n=1 Tax=Aegilops tauschii subsp. strangulata TaxID=200361 RepID=A0A453AV89_AEGTS